jgi:hypothetical protein
MAKRMRMTKRRWKREQRLFRKLEREGKAGLKRDARTATIRANA